MSSSTVLLNVVSHISRYWCIKWRNIYKKAWPVTFDKQKQLLSNRYLWWLKVANANTACHSKASELTLWFLVGVHFAHCFSFVCCVCVCFVCLCSVCCIQCCLCLWIGHSCMPLRFYLTFMNKTSKINKKKGSYSVYF